MGTTIDERVVSMKFDNKQFESGVSSSLNSIAKLKQGLNFNGASKGLDSISDSARRVNFDGLSNGLEAVKVKFSALQVVAITALSNIANSAITAGKNLISSLTIDPIMDGFREYETQMNAIQTILANTSTKGTSLDEVKASLAELNTYSDKTIYNFTEMTKNIGTFTAAGVDLKTSTAAIKGIANLAAVSGSNSTQASTAMYQLSQALAAGRVNLQDWNSVVNAGMGGAVFQNALKETAKVMGKTIDETQSFRDSISEKDGTGWLTSDVLLKTLEKFTGDMTESELAAQGYTESQIKDIMAMGVTANDAATKVKTFTQLLDTLKEAVGSGWAQTWQTLFGDFEEAKVMFTDVSNTLGGIISASSQARNEMLSGWKDLGGRTVLIDAIKNAFDSVMDVVKTLSGAFRDIFPATTSTQLFNFTEGLRNLTESFKMSDSTLNDLRSTFKGVFAIVDIGRQLFVGLVSALSTIISGSDKLGKSLLSMTGSFGEWLTAIDNSLKSTNVINTSMQALANVIRNVFSGAGNSLEYFGQKFAEVRTAVLKEIKFDPWVSFGNALTNVGKAVEFICEKISELQTKLSDLMTNFGQKFNGIDIGGTVSNVYKGLSDLLVGQADEVKKADDNMQSSFTTSMNNFIKNIGSISLGAIGFAITKMVLTLSTIFKKHGNIDSIFDNLTDSISKGLGSITGTLESVRDTLKTYQTQLKAEILLKIATAIGILAASIVAISMIDSGKLATSLAAVGGLFAQLLVATKLFTFIGEFKTSVIKSSIVMLTMSTSLLILANAMRIIGQLDISQTITSLGAILALMTMMTAVVKILSKDGGSFTKGVLGIIAFAEAIKILATACEKLGGLDFETIKKGVMGLGIIMAELSIFLKMNPSMGLKTASSILILSAALNNMYYAVKNIGDMDWENIKKGLLGLGGILIEVAAFDKLTSNAKNTLATSISLGIISVAINNMYYALNNIGNMDWENIKKGLMGIGGVLLEVATFGKLSSDTKNLVATSANLVIVAFALKQMYTPLSEIGGLDWENIKKGLIGMGGALLEISLFNKLNSGIKGSITSAISLGIAVSALTTLAKSLELFGDLDWENIKKGLIGMGGSLAEIVIMMNMLSKNTPVNAIALIGIATALSILSKAFIGFSGLSWDGIAKGITAISAALVAISIAMKLIPGDSIFTALGLTGIATAMVTMSQAMIPLAGLSWEGVAKGVIAIGGSLAVLAGGIKLMNGSLSGVAALILAATALNLLVPPILQLSTITWEGLLLSLTTLVGTIATLGIAATLLTPVIPAMFSLSAALVVLGVAIVGIGAGIALATLGFQQLAQAFTDLDGTTQEGAANVSSAMTAMIIGIANGIPTLVEKVGEGISSILQKLTDAIPALCEFVLKAIVEMTDQISKNAPLILDNVIRTLDSLLDILIKWIPTISSKVVDIILALLNVLNNNINKFTTAAVDIIVGFVKGITDSIPKIIQSAFDLVVKFINGLADAIRSNSGAINNACYNLVTAITDAIWSFNGKLVDAGIYVVEGFVRGIGNSIGKVIDAGKSLGRAAYQAAKDALDINSPSKEFDSLGGYSVLGFVRGLYRFGDKVTKAGASMGQSAMDSMTNTISKVTDVISGTIDSQPVISPVLDLTNIQNGTNQLYGMMSNLDNYSLNGSLGIANSASKMINKKQQIVDTSNVNDIKSDMSNASKPKQPVTLQLLLQNGKAIAEYIIDDVDELMGNKSIIEGRMVGV